MSKRYPGNFITGNPVALSQTSNNGIWDLKDNYVATGNTTWQEVDGVYEIDKSLRFKRDSSAYLSRTPGSSGNRRIFTWAGWVKRGSVVTLQSIMTVQNGGGEDSFAFLASGAIRWYQSAQSYGVTTVNYFRDPAAWYHLVLSVDNTQETATNRAKLYVNGVQQTMTGSDYASKNSDNFVCGAFAHYIGKYANQSGTNGQFEGHMAEVYLIDGQALDPSSFGYFDSVTNIWQPKKYNGGYGLNGFYLPFSDNSGLRGLGKNFAGTNYISYSQNFTGIWGGNYSALSNNNAVAPDGSTTAALLTVSSSAQYFSGSESFGFTSDNTPVTASIYLKQGTSGVTSFGIGMPSGYDRDRVDITWNGNNPPTVVQVAQGSQLGNSTCTYVGNGWYRFSVTTIYSGTGTFNLVVWGGGFQTTGTVYVWGAQTNLGTKADPYIATSGGTAKNNDWTTNNFSITAGATYDSMVDSPTNVFTSATDIGGVVSGNYATFNCLATNSGYNINTSAVTNGALQMSTSTANTLAYSTMGIPNQPYGKYYCEIKMDANSGGSPLIGLGTAQYQSLSGDSGWPQIAYRAGGTIDSNGSTILSGQTTYTAGDTIGIAIDMTTNGGQVTFYKNNTSIATRTGIIAQWGIYDIHVTCQTNAGSTGTFTANFGQRPFQYSPPAGHKSICTTNIQQFFPLSPAAVQPFKYFDAVGYTGNSTSNTAGNANNIVTTPGNFGPDLVWLKGRYGPVSSSNHLIEDSVRGPRRALITPATDGESGGAYRGIQTFLNNGIQFNNSAGGDGNYTGQQYISWMWKQSPNAGFNILSYTGNGTAARTISHNLGVAPTFIIWKKTSGTSNWYVWHKGMNQYFGSDGWLYLNAANSRQTSGTTNEYPTYKVNPTSSNITLNGSGSSNGTNDSGSDYICYAFADTPGFCKTGIWESTGYTEGPFVYTGFTPKFILWRNVSTGVEWIMKDRTREPYNYDDNAANLGSSKGVLENDGTHFGGPTGGNNIDWLSNGFKIRYNNGNMNYNYGGSVGSDKYAFIAFAESPFYLNNRAK